MVPVTSKQSVAQSGLLLYKEFKEIQNLGDEMREEIRKEIERKIAQSFQRARGPEPARMSDAQRESARLKWQESVGEKYEALVKVAMRKIS